MIAPNYMQIIGINTADFDNGKLVIYGDQNQVVGIDLKNADTMALVWLRDALVKVLDERLN